MKLTSSRVEEILIDCLFKEGEDTSNHVLAEGVIGKFGFNPERLSLYKEEIKFMLKELPDNFQQNLGGGMSFLQACEDKHGVQWGQHRSMDNLLILGIATEQAKILMPRDMWKMFPGGMPYFVVLD